MVNSSASGGLCPPDPLPGLRPWARLGDGSPPDPLLICSPRDKFLATPLVSDDGRTASTVQDYTSQQYQRFLPPVSQQKLCERTRQLVPAPRSTRDVWRGITYC